MTRENIDARYHESQLGVLHFVRSFLESLGRLIHLLRRDHAVVVEVEDPGHVRVALPARRLLLDRTHLGEVHVHARHVLLQID